MRILSLHVENFGTLHDVDEQFDAGLNVRLHPNGYGKSTLAVFIKAMLYGFPANTRRSSLIENERKRYSPWQGGVFGGSMDIEVGGKTYRIERSFGAKEADDTLTVLSLDTGEAAREDWASAPGEKLFGVGASAYERSTYLSQRPDDVTKDGMEGIHTKINGLADAADDLGNYERAMIALDRRRQHYALLKGRGGAVADSEDALAEVERRIESCEAARLSLDATRTRIDEATAAITAIDAELEHIRAQELALGRAREAKAIEDRIAALDRELATLREHVETLRSGLGGTVPTEATIEALQSALAARDELVHRAAPALDEAEVRELATLQARLGDSAPDAQQLDEMHAAANEYSRITVAAIAADPLFVTSAKKEPEEILCERQSTLSQAQRQYDQLCSDKEAVCARLTKHASLALPFVALMVSVALTLAGFALPLLFAVGGALLVASLVALLVILARRSARRRDDEARLVGLNHDISQAERQLHGAKTSLGAAESGVRFAKLWHGAVADEACPDGLEAPAAVDRLAARCERLRVLCDKQAKAGRSTEQANAAIEGADATIRALLAPMPGAPEDAGRALLWLTEQRRLLLDYAERYERKKQEIAALREQYDTGGEQHRSALALLDGTDADALVSRRTALEERRSLWAQTQLREQQSAERLSAEADELDGLENERSRRMAILGEQKDNLDAILQAEKFLKLARENLSGRYLDTMRDRFAHYMATLTGKEAPVFTMNGQFRASIRAAGAGRDSDAFSVGVRELIALCERLSLIDVMFEGERPFLVLDDPFANFDDGTVERAYRLLAAIADRYQILYLSCHSSRVPKQLDGYFEETV